MTKEKNCDCGGKCQDQKVEAFKKRGGLKAFACGVVKKITNKYNNMDDSSKYFAKKWGIGTVLTMSGAIASGPVGVSLLLLGTTFYTDGWVYAATGKSLAGNIKSGIKGIINKGRE